MKKSTIQPLPKFFDRYINLVEQDNLFEAFDVSLKVLNTIDIKIFSKIANKRYAPEKWTVKELLQHLIDNERIQTYRALRFSRGDTTILPGYDEKLLTDNSNVSNRLTIDLIEELKLVRLSSIQFFKSLDEKSAHKKGICFNVEISALALGFVNIGHQIHHMNVIKERYFPLLR